MERPDTQDLLAATVIAAILLAGARTSAAEGGGKSGPARQTAGEFEIGYRTEMPAMEIPTDKPTDEYIGAEGTEALGEPPRSGEAKLRDLDEMLDAALACSFPASDPVGCFSLCVQRS